MKRFALALLALLPLLAHAQTNTTTVTWTLATQYTDGSAILAGEYTGTNVYVDTVKKGAGTTTVGPTATSYVVSNLAYGPHQFAATSVTKNGAESALSNVVTKTVVDTRVPKPPTLLDAIIAWLRAHWHRFA